MNKPAAADHPIHDLIARRWSPRAYSDRPVDPAALRSVLEAARWAASSFNEQPWRYIVATRDNPQEFAKMLSLLVEGNQQWAKGAAVLMLAVASSNWSRNGKPNRHAMHDTGAATATLSLQATALGLQAHPMAGFDVVKARETYGIPPEYEPATAIALGYPADPATLSEETRQKEMTPRVRKPQSEFVFWGQWGQAMK